MYQWPRIQGEVHGLTNVTHHTRKATARALAGATIERSDKERNRGEKRYDRGCTMYKEAPTPTRVRHFLIAHRQRRSGPETR